MLNVNEAIYIILSTPSSSLPPTLSRSTFSNTIQKRHELDDGRNAIPRAPIRPKNSSVVSSSQLQIA